MLRLLRRVAYVLRHRRQDADLAEEIETHREMLERERRSCDGSRRALGNVTLAREDARAVWIAPWLESCWQDLRYGVRTLARAPGAVLLSVATLGCAIGLNSSLFTVFNAAVVRSWPVREPSRVLSLTPWLPLAEYAYLAGHSRAAAGMAASRCIDGLLTGCGVTLDGRNVIADFVTGNYFRVLGVPMIRGAGFPPESDQLAVPSAVAVIGYDAWQSGFSGDPAVIGRRILVDDVPFTIVGVTDRRFAGTSIDRREIWIPLNAIRLLRPDAVLDDRRREAAIVVRLADGVAATEARAELDLLHRQFEAGRQEPAEALDLSQTSVLREGQRRLFVRIFGLTFVALLLVLLLACANVGNLFLARAAARRAEIAIRVSIGASRRRVIRQLMIESLTVAGAAGVIGFVVAWNLPRVALSWFGGPTAIDLRPDAAVLSFTAALATLTCVAFGLAPAVLAVDRASRGNRNHAGASSVRLASGLLALQVAASVTLLVNAALLMRGALAISALDVGYEIDAVDVVSFDLPGSLPAERRRTFARQVLEDAGQAAGVAAGFASVAPFGETDKMWTTFRLPGKAVRPQDRDHDLLFIEASAGYFDVLRLPILAGRNFIAGDGGTGAVIVNQAMARRAWPGQGALGRSFLVEGRERWVVGIAADARSYAGNVTLVWPAMYDPIGVRIVPEMLIPSHAPGAAEALAAFAARIEPRARVRVSPLAARRARLLSEAQAGPWMAGAIALFAVVLAATGVFSLFAFTVAERGHEIGVRLALGAGRAHVVSLVVGTSARALAAGLFAGAAAAVTLSRLLGRFLYGLDPLDPRAYGAAALVLAIAALLATWLPARRALGVDPAVTLRN